MNSIDLFLNLFKCDSYWTLKLVKVKSHKALRRQSSLCKTFSNKKNVYPFFD